MIDGAVELVRLRNNFYRDNYRKAVKWLLFFLSVIVALIGVIFYQVSHMPPHDAYATTADGRIVLLQSHATAAAAQQVKM